MNPGQQKQRHTAVTELEAGVDSFVQTVTEKIVALELTFAEKEQALNEAMARLADIVVKAVDDETNARVKALKELRDDLNQQQRSAYIDFIHHTRMSFANRLRWIFGLQVKI